MKSTQITPAQTQHFWATVLDDFRDLALGHTQDNVVLAHDAHGRTWRFLLLFCKGDEQQRADEWGLVHYNAGDECCTECLADRTTRPFSDLQASAAWRSTTIGDLDTYLNRFRVPRHPLASSPFVWRQFFILDLMHIVDCKGVAATIFGGLMATLVTRNSLGRTVAIRMATLQAFINNWYDSHPGLIKLPQLTFANLWCDGWAALSGPAIKSAMTRQAVPMFAELAKAFCTSGSPQDELMKLITIKLDEFYTVLDAADLFLTPEQLAHFETVVQDLVTTLQHLRALADAAGLLRWPVKPKAHKLCHMPLVAASINPVKMTCYSDESHIGTLTKVWSKSIAGRYRPRAQANVLAKRWLSILLRLELGLD